MTHMAAAGIHRWCRYFHARAGLSVGSTPLHADCEYDPGREVREISRVMVGMITAPRRSYPFMGEGFTRAHLSAVLYVDSPFFPETVDVLSKLNTPDAPDDPPQ